MIGYGVAATAFAGLAITMVIRRESGVLKRIRSTPLPPATYIAAVLGSTLLVFVARDSGADHPRPGALSVPFPARWLSLILTCLLGAAAFAAMGVAVTDARALGRGLVGGRERDLPADGDHLRARSSRRTATRRSCARSPTCCR